MYEPIQAFCILVGACTASAAIGASFVFGVATVCRWMKWAPVNITVNVNNYGDAESCAVGSPVLTHEKGSGS